MNWHVTAFVVLLITFAITFALALYAWRQRGAPGAAAFTILMGAIAEWALLYAFELGSSTLADKLTWAKLQYIGSVIIPVAWLLFSLQFSSRMATISPRVVIPLLIVPCITLVLVWTNEYHRLVWTAAQLKTIDTLHILILTHGIWFWIHATYSYLLLLIGTGFLVSTIRHVSHLDRAQLSTMLVGILVPWVMNGMYLANLGPVPYLDLTPFAFAISGIAFAWSLFQLHLLNLLPVARDTLVEGMRDGIIVLDKHQRIVSLNPAAQQMLKARLAKTAGQPIAQLLPEVVPLLFDVHGDCDVHIVLGAEQEKQHFDLTISLLGGSPAGGAGFLLVLRDVTARVAMEQELRDSETRYRLLFDSNPHPMWVYDRETLAFLEVNDAAIQHYGYSREELLATTIDVIRRPDANMVPIELNKSAQPMLDAGRCVHGKKDGTLIDVEITAQPLSFAGRPATAILAKDVTARRRADEALRQQNEYLAALHETTLALMNRLEVDDALEAIVVRAAALVGTVHGHVYLVADCNELIIKVGIGIFREHIGFRLPRGVGVASKVWQTGKPLVVDNYDVWPERDPQAMWHTLGAVAGVPLTSGAAVVGVLGVASTEPGRTFTNEELVMLERFAQLASIALDNARLYTSAQQELAERKQAEASLAQARDEALEAARLKSEFLATMSHELRTPLNAIIGFTDLTLEEHIGTLNAQQRSNLQRVRRNAHALLELIDGILDLSKLDAGRVQLVNEPVFIREVVLSAINTIEALVTTKQLHLRIQSPPANMPHLLGDAQRVRQIVLNLLSNAVKFTPPHGTITVAIEHSGASQLSLAALPINGAPAGHWIVLSVQDTGIGVPAPEHERIWSEFYQVDGSPTRRYAGTGLGLAIVQRLTMLMGGHVGLRSVVGEGSTFSVWFPIRQRAGALATKPALLEVQSAEAA